MAIVTAEPRTVARAATRLRASDLLYTLTIGGLATLALVILVGPVVIVLLTSLTDGHSIKFPPSGLSLRWYRLLFDPVGSRQIHLAALNSLQVAVVTMVVATVLATLASVAIARRRGRWVRAVDTFFMSPMILPMLAFGLASLMYFTLMGFRTSLTLITIGGNRLVYLPLLIWQQSLVVYNWPLASVAALTLLVSVSLGVLGIAAIGRRAQAYAA